MWFNSVYPEARIVAVEPEPDNAEILRRNLADKPCFVVLEAAIGAEPGFVVIESGTKGWGARTAQAQSGTPMVTIADALG